MYKYLHHMVVYISLTNIASNTEVYIGMICNINQYIAVRFIVC